jgi:hypothetical protein
MLPLDVRIERIENRLTLAEGRIRELNSNHNKISGENEELRTLIRKTVKPLPPLPKAIDLQNNLLSVVIILPKHLQETIVELSKLGAATAQGIAHFTRRARAVESGYLNQLATMGYCTKERKKREVFFTLIEKLRE